MDPTIVRRAEPVTEGTPPTSPDPSPDSTSTDEPVEERPSTVEETEAFWRNRFSARDRAHNAEVAALKAQLGAASQPPATPPADETPEQRRIRELEAELAQQRAVAQAEVLRGKYPAAVSLLGDVSATVPEEKLAGWEAALAGQQQPAQPSPFMDPSQAGRRGATSAPKPVAEKTKAELEADLRAMSPAYQQMLRER
jgi:hypothetical protein